MIDKKFLWFNVKAPSEISVEVLSKEKSYFIYSLQYFALIISQAYFKACTLHGISYNHTTYLGKVQEV